MRYAVIVAGGAGTRLWPMSRAGAGGKPKQLLRFISPADGGEPRSLLQVAAARLRNLVDPHNVYICTGAAYASQILEELPLLPANQLLGEPMGRDTANAVGFSAAILHKRDPDATFAVLTADHIIEPVDVFQAAMNKAFDAAEKRPEYLFTFGITPTYPATGYGYVQRGPQLPNLPGVYQVTAFKEKPDLVTAQKFHAAKSPSGEPEFAWNSGMFVWKASTILEQIRQHLPAAHAGLMKIAAAWDTPRQAEVINAVYPTLQKVSIDIGIMEKAPHVAMIPMPVQWLDVGSWPALAETLPNDAQDNAVEAGMNVLIDSFNNIVISNDPEHLVALLGVSDMIVVHTKDATLVCPKTDDQRVKELVDRVKEKTGGRYQ